MPTNQPSDFENSWGACIWLKKTNVRENDETCRSISWYAMAQITQKQPSKKRRHSRSSWDYSQMTLHDEHASDKISPTEKKRYQAPFVSYIGCTANSLYVYHNLHCIKQNISRLEYDRMIFNCASNSFFLFITHAGFAKLWAPCAGHKIIGSKTKINI